jgi:hypothetical protein
MMLMLPLLTKTSEIAILSSTCDKQVHDARRAGLGVV